MKNLNHFKKIILNSIDLESYDITCESLSEVFENVYNIFEKEYKHNNNRYETDVKLFEDYLSGLPTILSVPYTNYDIIENALLDGINLKDEKEEGSFLISYFSNLSKAFFELKKEYK